MRSFLTILWRKKFILSAILLAALFSVHLATTDIKLPYTAKAVLIVEPDPAVKNTNLAIKSFHETRKLLKSQMLAALVIDQLNLTADPEFNTQHTKEELSDIETKRVISNLLSQLNVSPINDNTALEIAFTSTNPEKAATIANAITDIVIEQHLDHQTQASIRLTSRLDSYLTKLRHDLRRSERALTAYTKSLKSEETQEEQPDLDEEISEIQSNLLLAKAERAQFERRKKLIQSMGGTNMTLNDLLEFSDAQTIKNLKTEDKDIKTQQTELSKRYGAKHPQIIALNAKADALKAKTKKQIQSLIAKTNQGITSTKDRIATLEAQLQEIQPAAIDSPQTEQTPIEQATRIKELERAIQADQMLFAQFLKNYRLDLELAKIRSPNIRILYYASVPTIPAYSKHIAITVLGVLIAFITAWFAVFSVSFIFSRKGKYSLTLS